MEMLSDYQSSIMALGVIAILMFIQLLIADVVGIKHKHIPGATIATDHKSILFRASRAVANTNESVGIFIIAFAFALLSSASPSLMMYGAWGYVITRTIYALFYYANLKLYRSIAFVLVLVSILILIVAGVSTWF